MTTPVWIGLGSNLGDRKGILDAAVAALVDAPGVTVRAVSSYRETSPVGGPPGQGAFLNAAARLETALRPHQLLAIAREIEERAGRVRKVRWGERTLDLDLLIFGSRFLDTPELKLPHPRLALRRFVLAPLAEIAPTIMDPMTGRTIAELLANLDRRPRLLALDGPPGPLRASVFRQLVERLPASGTERTGRDAHRGNPPELVDRDSWGIATFSADPGSIGRIGEGVPRRATLRDAAEPTFVVILPRERRGIRTPGLMTAPQLWPQSDDPDAIVDEVLATCRGIEGA